MAWDGKGKGGTGGASNACKPPRCECATERRDPDDFGRGTVGNGATRRCGYRSSRTDSADADEVDGVGLLDRCSSSSRPGRTVEHAGTGWRGNVDCRSRPAALSGASSGSDSSEGRTPSRSYAARIESRSRSTTSLCGHDGRREVRRWIRGDRWMRVAGDGVRVRAGAAEGSDEV